jgi:NodT family efflux transporter outer membrane factor (OMF) lipoprotein
MVGPDYQRPDVPVPARWSEAPQATPATAPPPAEWWKAFRDRELDSLIDRATRANLDLALAEARIREARADRRIAIAPLWPRVDASGSYTRSWQSENAFATSPAGGQGAPGGIPSQPSNLYQIGFDAGWEIDVFGGLRRSVEAAQANLEASIYDRGDVLLTLLGEVSRNYIEVRSFQRQLDVTRRNLEAQRDTLGLTRARYQGGLASDLNVAQAEAQVSTTESEIPTLETSYKQAVHRLGVLLGAEPGALSEELAVTSPIPVAPPELPSELPSEVVRRRPDIRRAEWQLAAATAEVGVATADLFPKFSLTGTTGLESLSASDLFTGGSKLWSIGPTVTWPVFHGGQIRANIDKADAEQEQALIRYRQAVLSVLEEVENAIVAYTRERVRRQSLVAAVESNQRAVDHATALYVKGLSDFLNVLDAQRALFQTQTELAQSEAAVSENLVALNKALGGGWQAVPSRPVLKVG